MRELYVPAKQGLQEAEEMAGESLAERYLPAAHAVHEDIPLLDQKTDSHSIKLPAEQRKPAGQSTHQSSTGDT
jgi:hypothetical protein